MNVTKLVIAAGFAIAATGAYAETGVGTGQIGHVANIYGRAGAPVVKVTTAVATQPGSVADSGRDTAKGDSKLAVTSGKDAVEFGRS